ncbi:MAG: LemA family protein [Coriobacteriales bacterium]|jgi:LemA protein|nr:LemA family protein [Coriobacteriales bacterium]
MGAIIAVVVIVVIIIVILAIVISQFNAIRRLKQGVDEQWSGITVQLKRRNDLIPNLVETVKGYAAHEKSTFETIAQMRSAVAQGAQSGNAQATAKADNQLTDALSHLFAVAENYPDLKANQNFLQLQGEITDTEDKVAASRQLYNTAVNQLNTKITTFPGNIFRGMAGVAGETQYYEVPADQMAAIQEAPKVQF